MKIQEAIEMVADKEPMLTAIVTGLIPKSDPAVPTLGTDGEYLYYNQKFLDSLSKEEAAAVVLHEGLHCAFLHMWRRGKRETFKWNIATDFAINGMVNESFRLPKGCLLDPKYFGKSAENIYDLLPASKNKQQSWCDKGEWEKEGKKEEKKQSVGDKIKDAFKSESQKRREEWEKKMKSEKMKDKWERIYKKTMLDNYGSMPDSIQRVVEKSHYVPLVDWTPLVSNILSEDSTDYSFSIPDRRYLDSGFVLPDLYSIDKIKDVIFAYDTSGSISANDLRAFYMETLNLFSNFPTLTGWTAVCDAYLHRFSELNPRQTQADFGFMGGGGTDFNPVFNEIKKRDLKPKAVFYFTDTEGSFPRQAPEYPVYWLVRSQIDQDFSLDVPFGEVIRFLAK